MINDYINKDYKYAYNEYNDNNNQAPLIAILQELNDNPSYSSEEKKFISDIKQIAKSKNDQNILTLLLEVSRKLKNAGESGVTYQRVILDNINNKADCVKLIKESLLTDDYETSLSKIVDFIDEKKDFSIAVSVLQEITNSVCECKNEAAEYFIGKIDNLVRPYKSIFTLKLIWHVRRRWKRKFKSNDYDKYLKLKSLYIKETKMVFTSKTLYLCVSLAIFISTIFSFVLSIDLLSYGNILLTCTPNTITYGDSINLDNFDVLKQSKLFKIEYKIKVKENMFEYDPNHIGTQIAKFKYKKEVEEFELTILPKPLNVPTISIFNGMIDWSDENNVKEYIININNVDYTTTTNSEYNISNYPFSTQNIDVKVKAIPIDNRYESSSYSNVLSLYKLPTIMDISYLNNKIVWDVVDKASKYNIWINDVKYEALSNEFAYTSFKEGNNVIKIQACGNDNIIDGEIYEDNLIKYCIVDNIRYEENKIVWDYDYVNCDFEISVDNVKYLSNSNSLAIDFEFNKSYIVKIKVLSKDDKHIDSLYSSEISLVNRKLDTPNVTIKLGDYSNTYSIVIYEIKQATSYEVLVTLYKADNSIYSTNTYVLTNSLKQEIVVNNEISKIVVIVKAIDDTNNYVSSDEKIVERQL